MPAQRLGRTSLAALNTFGVQAYADELWRVESIADLPALIAQLNRAGEAHPLVLGAGSNLLLAGDVDRPVIQVGLPGLRVLRRAGESFIVEAGAGESWDTLVRWSLGAGLAGLENLALIPGTVGAAPIQNIGAYGVELRDRFDSLDAIDLRSGRWRSFDAQDCAFDYRHSVFKTADGAHWMVCAVRMQLQPADTAAVHLDYGDIRDELTHMHIDTPRPADVANAVSAIRRRKLPDPAVLGNAGSFFKNPIINARAADELRAREPHLPMWPAAHAHLKLSAAWMIDRCGWKGHRAGDAGVHAAHALVLVNHGQASGRDLLALAEQICDSVQARFGVRLEPEPLIVGTATL